MSCMNDLLSKIRGAGVFTALAGADASSQAVDTTGFQSLTFIGEFTNSDENGGPQLALQHSEDGITYEPVGADDVLPWDHENGTGSIAFPSGVEGELKIGYVGNRRFVICDVVKNGNSSDVTLGAILGHPEVAPT